MRQKPRHLVMLSQWHPGPPILLARIGNDPTSDLNGSEAISTVSRRPLESIYRRDGFRQQMQAILLYLDSSHSDHTDRHGAALDGAAAAERLEDSKVVEWPSLTFPP